jgi:uncharacterized circularly permuted ATP-grasp superfamily protein
MLEQAVADYHALLEPDVARASQERLTAGLRERDLFFGDRPLVTVLRPRLISAAQYQLLRDAVSLVAAASRAVVAAAEQHPELRAVLALTPGEERLLALHPGYSEPSAHSRMDTFLTLDGSSLQFVEYNAESPAAIAYQDALSEVFFSLPVLQQFQRRYRVDSLPARHLLLDTLLGTWREFGGAGSPRIAILDWKDLPTRSEFELFQRYFRDHGLEAAICSPDDLVLRDGRLFARDYAGRGPAQGEFPIDLVYKRVLTSELLMRYGEELFAHPLVRAYSAGAVCLVNSFRAKLLHKKSLFALLTDDATQPLLSPQQRAAVARHVPWTRLMRPGPTSYQGQPVDLLAFARANQERLLLKPNDEYGGKGIVIGWECGPAAWEQALAEALQSPFVLQERVQIAYEDYPSLVDGQVQIERRLVDSDPFLFGTHCEGCLTRLSTVTLLNVTAGGGSTVPMFVVEPKG